MLENINYIDSAKVLSLKSVLPGKSSWNFGKCSILYDPDCCASSFLLLEVSDNDPVYPIDEPYSSSINEQRPFRIVPAVQHGFHFSG